MAGGFGGSGGHDESAGLMGLLGLVGLLHWMVLVGQEIKMSPVGTHFTFWRSQTSLWFDSHMWISYSP